MGVAVVLLANVFLGGGKCPNLGVVNVRILGVVNVLLANDSQSFCNSSQLLKVRQKPEPEPLSSMKPCKFT